VSVSFPRVPRISDSHSDLGRHDSPVRRREREPRQALASKLLAALLTRPLHGYHFTVTPNLILQPRAAMSDERRPRSRFDSDEPERPTRSRFDTDRRSRSPSRRESESLRERSPVTREATDSPSNAGTKNKAAAAAAAAAARINAQIQAKKGIQHVDVPPIRAVRSSVAKVLESSLTPFHRRPLLQSSSRRLPTPASPLPAKYTNKMVTSSKTLKSTILEIAIL
jgi:hypothetical protein